MQLVFVGHEKVNDGWNRVNGLTSNAHSGSLFSMQVRTNLLSKTKLLLRHARSVKSRLDLLHSNTSCEIGTPVFRLHINAERTQPAIFGRT